jgi:hypothetical protein
MLCMYVIAGPESKLRASKATQIEFHPSRSRKTPPELSLHPWTEHICAYGTAKPVVEVARLESNVHVDLGYMITPGANSR